MARSIQTSAFNRGSMKKGIVVLLITVLVAGFAFAGKFNGSAGIEFGVDFDDQEWGFENTLSGKYTFSFELDTTAVALGDEHQTDVWAELAADASAYIAVSKAGLGSSVAITPYYTAEITKANIHIGEHWTIGIISAGAAKSWAQHYTILSSGSPKYNTLAKVTGPDGFTVSYAVDEDTVWYGGFGAEGTWGDNAAGDTYTVFAHLQTPDFQFGENQEVTVAGGAHMLLTEDESTNSFGGGFFAAYKADKFDVDFEGDLRYTNEKFLYELALNSNLNFVEDLPIYVHVYATPGALTGNANYSGDDAEALKLDAKAGTSYTIDIDEEAGTAVDLAGYVEVEDAVIDDLALTVYASEEATIDAFTVGASEKVVINNLANDADATTTLTIGANVEYAHEKFTAYAEATTVFLFDALDSTDTFTTFALEAGISSETIVEGAELALVYENANFVAENKGAITASCTISF